jgi:hypothetical protein
LLFVVPRMPLHRRNIWGQLGVMSCSWNLAASELSNLFSFEESHVSQSWHIAVSNYDRVTLAVLQPLRLFWMEGALIE